MKQPPTILHSLLYNIPKTALINYEMGKREIKSDSLPLDKEKKTQKKKKTKINKEQRDANKINNMETFKNHS